MKGPPGVCGCCRGVRDPYFECPDCHDRPPQAPLAEVECPACHGDGLVDTWCRACGGTGFDEDESGEECRSCEGFGTEHRECDVCHGTGAVSVRA